jgi:hypothetical protein
MSVRRLSATMHSIDPEKIDGLECALSASGVRRNHRRWDNLSFSK